MKRLVRALRRYFITGILVLLPLAVTLYVLWLVFSLVDNAFANLVAWVFGRHIPGVGLVLTLALILGIGIFAANVIGSRIIAFFERVLTRIPLVRTIYNAVKQIIDAFTITNQGAFQQVAMVEFPRKGTYAIGFITNDEPTFLANVIGSDNLVTVFIPTIPNVTTGFFQTFPRSEVKVLDISLEDGFKMIMSAGAVIPKDIKETGAKGQV